MSVFYECTICQHANTSIMDLHNHHMQHHNLEELSQTIISLQGFKVFNDMKCMKKKYFKSINLGDDNNNGNLYNNFFIKPKPQNHSVYKNEQIIDLPTKFGHDSITCSIKCSQFIAWEHELNKRQEINDEEFFNTIESLCYDLSKRKRRGRKKKDRTGIEKMDTGNLMQHIMTIIGVDNKAMEQLNTQPCQTTTSVLNMNDSIINTTINDKVLLSEIKNEIEDTTNNENTTLKLVNTNEDTNVLMHYPSCSNFCWNSIITVNADELKESTEENIYPESMEINFANFL